MDRPREIRTRKRSLRRISFVAVILLGAGAITVGFSRLEQAPPTIDRDLLWIDTVRSGEFVQRVRATGTLVPKFDWWVPATVEGRVEEILVRPGETVQPGDVILTLSNPVLERDVHDAEWQLAAAEAQLTSQKAKLESERLDREDALVSLEAEMAVAKMAAERDQGLFEDGIISELVRDTSQAKLDELRTRVDLAKRRITTTEKAHDAELSVQRATVEQLRALVTLRKQQLKDLKVTTRQPGVLQQLLVEEGQQVAPGTSLVKIARQDELKAELRVAETQTRDIQVGQQVSIDTHNGLIEGRVTRIDPAVLQGSVQVDVELTGALPKGARPDLSVEGAIEIGHLDQTLFVARPVTVRENAAVELFRMNPADDTATRVRVRLGRTSVNYVQVVEGLNAGDRVILSDMSKWDNVDRVRLR